MNSHLSDDQFARCIVGRATSAELQHSRECAQCGAELSRFRKAVSLFQSAVRKDIDNRIALFPSVRVSRPADTSIWKQRWVLVAAAAIVLMVLPFIRTGDKTEEFPGPVSSAADPEAVMNRVNLQLSRNVPAPMEPLLLGLPDLKP